MTFVLVAVVYAVAIGKPSFTETGPIAVGFSLWASAIVGKSPVMPQTSHTTLRHGPLFKVWGMVHSRQIALVGTCISAQSKVCRVPDSAVHLAFGFRQ